jgi:predicted glycosyltransferase
VVEHFSFSGYVTGFDQSAIRDRAGLRRRLGYGEAERICIVSVGGSGVGADLLRRVIAAYPEAQQSIDSLRMVVVAGPPDRLRDRLAQRDRACTAPIRTAC